MFYSKSKKITALFILLCLGFCSKSGLAQQKNKERKGADPVFGIYDSYYNMFKDAGFTDKEYIAFRIAVLVFSIKWRKGIATEEEKEQYETYYNNIQKRLKKAGYTENDIELIFRKREQKMDELDIDLLRKNLEKHGYSQKEIYLYTNLCSNEKKTMKFMKEISQKSSKLADEFLSLYAKR